MREKRSNTMPRVQSIAPCLWFADQGEQAARFYTSIFPNSKIGAITRYGEAGQEIHGRPPGSIMTVAFELDGAPFTALNGGPGFRFSEAISFQVSCETQSDIDYFWEKLGAGGDPNAQQCGWLKDKFGVSWQILPVVLSELFDDADSQAAERTMHALLQMKKLDIATLMRAHGGHPH
jgi:predicted 3-demethylubiquinone-9 3-methyltransferase (glyoxalase superfamily)